MVYGKHVAMKIKFLQYDAVSLQNIDDHVLSRYQILLHIPIQAMFATTLLSVVFDFPTSQYLFQTQNQSIMKNIFDTYLKLVKQYDETHCQHDEVTQPYLLQCLSLRQC